MAVRGIAAALVAVLLVPTSGQAQALPPDSALVVEEIRFDTARPGINPLAVRVRNRANTAVLTVLDLRAVPGMWMSPNMQDQYAARLAPGQVATIEGTYEFVHLTPEATLRVTVGPGEYLEEWDVHLVRRADFRQTYPVGRDSPYALDPGKLFTVVRRGPLEIWAWKGSLAEARLEATAGERMRSLEATEELLDVRAPERIRLVFYPDQATKLEDTGHRGVGLARDSTLVEVYNDSVRMDPFHEMVHVLGAAAGDPPPLLGEGLAVYVSESLGGDALEFLGAPGLSPDRVTCRVAGTSEFVPLDELLTLDNIPGDSARAVREYAEAGSFVKHLIEGRGLERFRQAYGIVPGQDGAEARRESLRALYGTGVRELEREWLGAVAGACDRGP